MTPSRIMVADYAGHPFPAELSREFAKRGHCVLHMYCASYVGGKSRLARSVADSTGLSFISGTLAEPFAKYSIRKRFAQEREFGALLRKEAVAFHPDYVISANMPLFAQRALHSYCHESRIPFIFWLQDITSIAMSNELTKRLPGIGAVGGTYLKRLEQSMLRSSDAVVAISDDFVALLEAWKVPVSSVTVIPNWSSLADVVPQPRDNAWATEHHLSPGFRYVYAGTLGLKHNPGFLVELAAADPTCQVVVVSEGVGADLIGLEATRRKMSNITLLPFQPYDQLSDILGSADVLVAVLEEQAGVFSVPSKVLSYLCASRAVLASLPSTNLAARLLTSSGSGLVSNPADIDQWLSNARLMREDDDLRARMAEAGRTYAVSNFSIGPIADRFQEVALLSHARHHVDGRYGAPEAA